MNQVIHTAKSKVEKTVRVSFLASVKLTIMSMIMIATAILLGAWCPQESQSGFAKVVEQFGPQNARFLKDLGITDIYHSPIFLALVGILTVNMIACSFQRVFPKIRSLKLPMVFLGGKEISKLANHRHVSLYADRAAVIPFIGQLLKKRHYSVNVQGKSLTGEFGKFGRLAATITHIGLLSLMAGVTITSWTGFNGFQPVLLGETMKFDSSEHSKLWIGKLPGWRVKVEATRRENYKTGEAKQWYSTLSVIDKNGKVVKTQEISVNNPLSYDGVDIYQSSWGLERAIVSFNGNKLGLPLRPMGDTYAAFLPLDERTTLIFSLRGQEKPLRLFAKIPEWPAPRLITELPAGQAADLGGVTVAYHKAIPVTGLQYKADPGLPVTYVAFAIIMLGVILAAVPHRQTWVAVEAVEKERQDLASVADSRTAGINNGVTANGPDTGTDGASDSDASIGSINVYIGGVSRKAKRAYEKELAKIIAQLEQEFGAGSGAVSANPADSASSVNPVVTTIS